MAFSKPVPKEALPTQKFIEVRGVKNGVLILKGGGLRQILMVSGLNFDLKSEEEQEAITYAYQGFLNSLNFTLQIFVHSRKVNVDSYLENLLKIESVETNPLLKTQIAEYREFIAAFVRENAIMNKTFFAVVPYDPISLPKTGAGTTTKLFGFLSKSKGKPTAATPSVDEDKDLDRKISQLGQRTEQVVSGLNQMGLRAVPLNDEEVIDLFYNLYNPETVEKKIEIANQSKRQ